MVIALMLRKRSSASHRAGGNRASKRSGVVLFESHARGGWSLSSACLYKGLFEEKRYALRTIELSKLLGFTAISLEQLIALFS